MPLISDAGPERLEIEQDTIQIKRSVGIGCIPRKVVLAIPKLIVKRFPIFVFDRFVVFRVRYVGSGDVVPADYAVFCGLVRPEIDDRIPLGVAKRISDDTVIDTGPGGTDLGKA